MQHAAPVAVLPSRRRIFPAWSVEVPDTFDETFVADDGYWHAWDEHRSVSLTSLVLTDKRGRPSQEAIAAQLPELEGTPLVDGPPGLTSRAVLTDAVQPARAARVLTGFLVADGRVLLATITSDDLDWARSVWSSIRYHESGELLRTPVQSNRAMRRSSRTGRR
jgi:hypothetical protein